MVHTRVQASTLGYPCVCEASASYNNIFVRHSNHAGPSLASAWPSALAWTSSRPMSLPFHSSLVTRSSSSSSQPSTSLQSSKCCHQLCICHSIVASDLSLVVTSSQVLDHCVCVTAGFRCCWRIHQIKTACPKDIRSAEAC